MYLFQRAIWAFLTRFVLDPDYRPPAVQLHLRPNGSHALRGVVAGRPVLRAVAAAATSHRMHGSGARRPHPPLQPDPAQTGRAVAKWADLGEESPLIGTQFPPLDPPYPSGGHLKFYFVRTKRLWFKWSTWLDLLLEKKGGWELSKRRCSKASFFFACVQHLVSAQICIDLWM